MGLLVSLIFLLIVCGIVWAIAKAIVAIFKLPPETLNIAWLVILLVLLIWVVQVFSGGGPFLGLHGRLF